MKKPKPTPLRQKFIKFLTLRFLSHRTIQSYTDYIVRLAKFHRKSPDILTSAEVQDWLYYLLIKRHYTASSVGVAINAVHCFYGRFLGRDCDPILHDIVRPKLEPRLPRVFSIEEIETLLTVGCQDDPRAKAFLSMVYGGGLRLNEATHVQVEDLCSDRHQLRVRQPKGGKPRYTLLSESLLQILRSYYRQFSPQGSYLFPGIRPDSPISSTCGQRLFYDAMRRAKLRGERGIHCLRHSFATHLIESGVEITTVQHLLGHARLASTAIYLHVREERVQQIQSPLGLLNLTPRS